MKNLTDMREWQNWNMQLTQNQSPLWIGGSNPLSRTYAPVAQLAEHETFNLGVVGPIPTRGTIFYNR